MNHEPIARQKQHFLTYELGLLSVKAALSTRDADWPIYALAVKTHQRGPVQDRIRALLQHIEVRYLGAMPSEDEHVGFIVETADTLSSELSPYLVNGRFRIGVAQKLINLHLKYLWVAGLVEEPPHCPLDGIVRDLASLDYDWTRTDCISEYRKAIAALRRIAEPRSLSEWELCEFRRRAQ